MTAPQEPHGSHRQPPRDPSPPPAPSDPTADRKRRRTPAEFLGTLPRPERAYLADALRTETAGGVLLLAAAVIALVWANSPLSDSYTDTLHTRFGPAAVDLNLSVGHWAADGLLTIFFFVAGIELKRELVAGELRSPSAALLPVFAAVCGMAVPAAVYAVVNAAGGGRLDGWAVPTATDIAFALAILAVIGTALPAALRAFLLTLAVVDDLLAILIIAVFFTSSIRLLQLGLAVLGLAVFGLLLRLRVRGWYVYLPLAVVTWALLHASGVHSTIAGVAMGLMLRCHREEGEAESPGERIEHLVRPVSAGLAVPLFALFSAGVSLSGGVLTAVFTRPETLGVVFGLVVGKTVGVFGGSWLAARFTRARLNPELSWSDVLAVASLAGVGFTVSLLITELAFADDARLAAEVKASVLVASVVAAVCASVLLRLRDNAYRRMAVEEDREDGRTNGTGEPPGDDAAEAYGTAGGSAYDDPGGDGGGPGDARYHLRMAAILEERAAEHRRLARVAGAARADGGRSGMIGDEREGAPARATGPAAGPSARHDTEER
jgi:NhaA family Na+:H+ antiporter